MHAEHTSLEHLPDWAQTRCAACGEYALPDSGLVASGGQPLRHITADGCLENRERFATLPVEATLMHQALVEASRTLKVFVQEASDDAWVQEVSDAVFSAISSIDRGLDARRLVAFKAPEAPNV